MTHARAIFKNKKINFVSAPSSVESEPFEAHRTTMPFSNRFSFLSSQFRKTKSQSLRCYQPIEFMSDIYLPSLIPPPNCNCRSCKPSMYMFPLHHQHQPRVLSALPKPPIIPPPPRLQSTDSLFLSLKTPTPPPRRYQLIPIRNESQSHRPHLDAFTSFGKTSRGAFDSGRHDYENTSVIVPISPVVVNAIPKIPNDERRKPYYYNELSMLPGNGMMQSSNYAEQCVTNASCRERENESSGADDTMATDENELKRNTIFNANLVSHSSGDSLDNIV